MSKKNFRFFINKQIKILSTQRFKNQIINKIKYLQMEIKLAKIYLQYFVYD